MNDKLHTSTSTIPCNTRTGLVVIADRLDALTIRNSTRGPVPHAVVLGGELGAVLGWELDDRIELLAPADCAGMCDSDSSWYANEDRARTLAAALAHLRPSTLDLRISCLWRSPGMATHLAATIALTCQEVVANGVHIDLTDEGSHAHWRQYATWQHHEATHPHWPPPPAFGDPTQVGHTAAVAA